MNPATPLRPLSKCTPERDADKRLDAKWFRDWCAARRISERDLAAILDVTLATAHRKMLGESPINITDIRRFPDRYRDELLHDFSRWCRVAAA